jgi:tRNA (cmo5U34)-methyltransferase
MQKLGVPQKSTMLKFMINLLAFKKAKPRFLEIGGGLGVFSSMILKKYPQARFVLSDGSSEMIFNAKKRLTKYKSNITFLQRDINHTDWFEGITGSFDAIVSSWCLHYLSDDRRKPFFKEIYKLLKPSGIFVYSCSIQPENKKFLRLYNEIETSRIKGSFMKLGMDISESQIQEMADEGHSRARINPAYFDEYLKFMKSAGFSSSGCVWKYLFNAVFLAHKLK